MPQERDPFPFPRYENDDTYTGNKAIQKLPYDKPAHLAQNDEPWRRLHNTTTQASSHRNVFHYDATAPNDSLDIHLKSTYDHHLGLFQNKSQTMTQKETLALDNATLKNRESEDSVYENSNKGIKVWVDIQKASIYSIKGSIESHHTASTNRGYSLSTVDALSEKASRSSLQKLPSRLLSSLYPSRATTRIRSNKIMV